MTMIAWKTLPNSIRATVGDIEMDVWHTTEGYKFTVMHSGIYIDTGICRTQDAACEKAMAIAKI